MLVVKRQIFHDGKRVFHCGAAVHHGVERFHELDAVRVVEDVAPDGQPCAASLQRVVDHLEKAEIRVYHLAARDDNGTAAAFRDPAEGFWRSSVGDFDDVRPEFCADSGALGHDIDVEAVADEAAASVEHHEQRHAPAVAVVGDEAGSVEHLALIGIAKIDVDGNGIRTKAYGFFHRAGKDFDVAHGGKVGGARDVHDEAEPGIGIRTAGSPDEALMHEDGVGSADVHVVDSLADVYQTFRSTDGHAVIHRDDDGPMGIGIEDVRQSFLSAEFHDAPLQKGRLRLGLAGRTM